MLITNLIAKRGGGIAAPPPLAYGHTQSGGHKNLTELFDLLFSSNRKEKNSFSTGVRRVCQDGAHQRNGWFH
jgi:hypothetical protein